MNTLEESATPSQIIHWNDLSYPVHKIDFPLVGGIPVLPYSFNPKGLDFFVIFFHDITCYFSLLSSFSPRAFQTLCSHPLQSGVGLNFF